VTNILRHGGIYTIYTGLSVPLAAQSCYKATIYTVNRLVREITLSSKSSLSYIDYFICGATAGAVNAFIFVTPVEYIRNQLINNQMCRSKYSSQVLRRPKDIIRETICKSNFLGLWRGVTVTVLRDSIGCGSFFVSFEYGRHHLPSLTNQSPTYLSNLLASGCMAGFSYWITSLPLDTLKTLLQTQSSNKTIMARHIVRSLLLKHGLIGMIRELYIGLPLAIIRGTPSAAVSLLTYTTMYQWSTTMSYRAI